MFDRSHAKADAARAEAEMGKVQAHPAADAAGADCEGKRRPEEEEGK